jgi:bifunctional ADP-heptose synthase (sugar kinase/adenylyltransferase)
MSSGEMLTAAVVEGVLARAPALRVGVVGDLFLDRYLDLDAGLTEPSLETDLDAYQVVGVRPCPGAAGTVLNNLVALGAGRVVPIAVIGDDGEGYELRQALARLPAVEAGGVFAWPGRRTPAYTKPMLHEAGRPPRELNRLDVHNRSALPAGAEARVLELLEAAWPGLDGLVVLDQVGLPDCGVVTARLRGRLGELAARDPGKPVLADSRERVGLFRGVCLKPNQHEALRAAGGEDLPAAVRELARRAGRPVFCTQGERGILLADPAREQLVQVPGYPVEGPTDPVGAGDSTSAGILCALAAGATGAQAAAFGNLVASVTVRQLGTTGTATPDQVRQRWAEVG